MTSLRDVAHRLNLSNTTVSRALDGYDDVAEETRQLVVRTAREMGYVPNRAARQLRRKKADAIGYILPAEQPCFADPFHTEFLIGLGDETALHPFDLLVSIAPPGAEEEQRIYQNWVLGRKVDGFILNRMRHNDWRASFLLEQDVPFTALEYDHPDVRYPFVEVDSIAGMLVLIQHLKTSGYQRPAFIGGPDELTLQTQRLAGFRQGLQQAGLPYDLQLVLSADLTANGGYQAVKRLRWLPDPPDAIVCINDETAFGVLHALHEMNLRAGLKIGVTGFDGVQVSQHTDPPLTTLDIPVGEIAHQLVRMLVAELSGELHNERQVVIQPRLLKRESTQRH